MRHILLIILFFAIGELSFAQCGKSTVLTSSKTIHMNRAGNIERTDGEVSVVKIHGKSVKIDVNGEHRATCTIRSLDCYWSVPFKEGKMVLNTTMTNSQGELTNAIAVIEGAIGNLSMSFTIEDNPDKVVKVIIDKFEEQK